MTDSHGLFRFANGSHLGSTGGVSAWHHRITSSEADSLIISKGSPGAVFSFFECFWCSCAHSCAGKGCHRRAASMASTSSLASAASTEIEMSDP